MSRLTLRQLEYLVAVGETGSIARAADRLNVSSPSISSAITQLEEELAMLDKKDEAEVKLEESRKKRGEEQKKREKEILHAKLGALQNAAGMEAGMMEEGTTAVSIVDEPLLCLANNSSTDFRYSLNLSFKSCVLIVAALLSSSSF